LAMYFRLCVDPSVRKYMAKYWLGLDLTGFDPLNERPRTALYEQALRASLPAEVLFLAHVAESLVWDEDGSGRGYKTEPSGWCVSNGALYARFTAWCLEVTTSKRPQSDKAQFFNQLQREAGLICEGLVGPLTLPPGADNPFTDERGMQARGFRIDVLALRAWLVVRGVGKAEVKAAAPVVEEAF
jgi:hypothetical protein